MDKRVIFAVAGAGKTATIIDSLSLDCRALIVTYTQNNYEQLRQRIIRKFGLIPKGVTVVTYFTFLYSFCYKPFLADRCGAKGINWNTPPSATLRMKRTQSAFYIDSSGLLYSNRIAKLIDQTEATSDVINRLSKYYDHFFVDEIQDFGGHDFNLIMSLCEAGIDITFVGDFYQHTFDTSRDGNINTALHKSFEGYKGRFRKAGLKVDTTSLSRSHRCTQEVCSFIEGELNIEIKSHKATSSVVELVDDKREIQTLFECRNTVKLFYQNYNRYCCYSQNWGKCKGQDHYADVCVVMYPAAAKALKDGNLNGLKPSVKNKLYVACTRANANLYFVDEARVKHLKS